METTYELVMTRLQNYTTWMQKVMKTLELYSSEKCIVGTSYNIINLMSYQPSLD